MKKGQILEGTIERVDFPNKGVIPLGDRQAIVKNGLPGQKIRFSVVFILAIAAAALIEIFHMRSSWN